LAPKGIRGPSKAKKNISQKRQWKFLLGWAFLDMYNRLVKVGTSVLKNIDGRSCGHLNEYQKRKISAQFRGILTYIICFNFPMSLILINLDPDIQIYLSNSHPLQGHSSALFCEMSHFAVPIYPHLSVRVTLIDKPRHSPSSVTVKPWVLCRSRL
jgi:hypothetical protein